MISISCGNKKQVEEEIQKILNDFDKKVRELIGINATKPRTCETCDDDREENPEHYAAEYASLRPVSVKDVETVRKALNRYALKSNYNDDDVGECQAEEALDAFDRIAGKLG